MAAEPSDGVSAALSAAVLGLVAVRLVSGVRASRTSGGRSVLAAVRGRLAWRHVWPVPFVLAAVVAAASVLMLVPGLDWGWWTELGGTGNPVLGSTDSTAGTVWEWLLPIGFVLLLLPALPLFAHAEERMFRRGAEHWSPLRRAAVTVGFGLVHAIVGVPIGAALALSIGGAWFMATYLRAHRATRSREAALLESTAAHTAYNGVILVALLAVLVVTGVLELV